MNEGYVLYSVEYILGAGLRNEPVCYVLGIYSSKEAAMTRKKIEQQKALEAGYYHIVYYVEELEVYKKYKNINNMKPKTY